MHELAGVAPRFVEMAHSVVWCSAATVDKRGRPHSRILHPIWLWDGAELVGWIATGPTPVKRAHLEASPHMSLSYWAPTHDTCSAECRVEPRRLRVFRGWRPARRDRRGPDLASLTRARMAERPTGAYPTS